MKRLGLLAAVLASLVAAQGCAERETVVREHEVGYADGTRHTVVEAERQVTTDEDEDGVLGATFGLIGDIVALPFRIVGGIIDLIF